MNDKFVEKLINRLEIELNKKDRSGVYGLTQRQLAYNSNKIEGSKLTEEQTYSLFDTGTLKDDGNYLRSKDIEEMTGHFIMFNEMIKTYDKLLTEELIKEYHKCLKSGVFEDIANGYPIGEYKNRSNIVSNIKTTSPLEVQNSMQELLSNYNKITNPTIDDIAKFHASYEKIHPFQEPNGIRYFFYL